MTFPAALSGLPSFGTVRDDSTTSMNGTTLRRAAELIRQADGLLVTAGAGMGVDSGLPDFRGTEGFWRAYPALGRAGLRFESIASPHTFESDPSLAWGFYGHRLNLYRRTVPHEGFSILKRWADRKPLGALQGQPCEPAVRAWRATSSLTAPWGLF